MAATDGGWGKEQVTLFSAMSEGNVETRILP